MPLGKNFALLLFCAMVVCCAGCGTFVANRMTQAPNTYPTYLSPQGSITIAPKPRVELSYNPDVLAKFHRQHLTVGPPDARISYRVVEPGEYGFKSSVSNWTEGGKEFFEFDFKTAKDVKTNRWTASPKGTVVLLHGYGLAQFSMAPWAIFLAQEGWRCVLVDLRGHGKSSGAKIYYGIVESGDMSQLLDRLDAEHRLARPIAVVGESYGASLALRWKTQDTRLGPIVAIAPYGVLSNAVMNIVGNYAGWVPQWLLKSGMKQLPLVIGVAPCELDINTVLKNKPVPALFVAGGSDEVMKPSEVRALCDLAGNGSKFILEPKATHEAVTYFFDDLGPALLDWLEPGHVMTSGGQTSNMLHSSSETARQIEGK